MSTVFPYNSTRAKSKLSQTLMTFKMDLKEKKESGAYKDTLSFSAFSFHKLKNIKKFSQFLTDTLIFIWSRKLEFVCLKENKTLY